LAFATDAPQAFDPMLLVRSDLTSDWSCLTELQVRNWRKQSPIVILRTKPNFAD